MGWIQRSKGDDPPPSEQPPYHHRVRNSDHLAMQSTPRMKNFPWEVTSLNRRARAARPRGWIRKSSVDPPPSD